MYFDAHLDLGYYVYWKRYLGEKEVINRHYYDDFVGGGMKLVIAAIYIDDIFLPDMGLKMAIREINALLEEIEESMDRYMLIKCKEDLKELLQSDKIGIILSLEGLAPIENDIEMLKSFYRLGIRGLGLSWSRRNYVIDGVGTFSNENRGGLTKFGEEVIEFANEKGMFIDVSHANDLGIEDVLKISSKKIIASHSNPRSLHGIERNLPDKFIASLGFIGVNGYNKNMAELDEGLDVKTVADHIEYFVEKSDENSVGLGFDMIGKLHDIPQIQRREANDRKGYDVIAHHGLVPLLEKELVDRGWPKEKIEKIMWRNLFNYLMINL
ncbi:MAG: membrane dipeptidase [Clostridiales bacterium]|nr:membrane dipeptidase [Clostridiales bacterium]